MLEGLRRYKGKLQHEKCRGVFTSMESPYVVWISCSSSLKSNICSLQWTKNEHGQAVTHHKAQTIHVHFFVCCGEAKHLESTSPAVCFQYMSSREILICRIIAYLRSLNLLIFSTPLLVLHIQVNFRRHNLTFAVSRLP